MRKAFRWASQSPAVPLTGMAATLAMTSGNAAMGTGVIAGLTLTFAVDAKGRGSRATVNAELIVTLVVD